MSNTLFNQITKLMSAGEHFRATNVIKPLIEERPNDPYLYYLMGIVWHDAEMPHIAVQWFSNALNFKPNNTPVLLALGISQQGAEQFEEAIETLKGVIQLNRDIPESYNSLGMTYKKMGRLSEAVRSYDEGLQCLTRLASAEAKRIDPSVNSHIVGSDVFVSPQLFEKSREILKSTPHYTITSNNLGICLAELGDIEGAKNAYREAIEFMPNGYDYPFPAINLRELENLG